MKRWRHLAACGLLCTWVSCQREPPPSATPSAPPPSLDPALVDGESALREVAELLKLGPRLAGTESAKAAAEYIGQRLRAHGVDAKMDSFTDETPAGPKEFHNVMGTIPGSMPGLIFLAGHFDTKHGIADDFAGANDGGSSTGLLLELARYYQSADWKGPTLIFAFFDGEEARFGYSDRDGLHGSRYLARQIVKERRQEQVLAFINLDMIGDRDLSITLPADTQPAMARLAFKAATNLGLRDKISYFRHPILDDHTPFQNLGIPAIDLIDFQFGSRPGMNDYWHTEEDTLDKLSANSLAAAGRMAVEMIHLLLSTPPQE